MVPAVLLIFSQYLPIFSLIESYEGLLKCQRITYVSEVPETENLECKYHEDKINGIQYLEKNAF